MLGRLFASASGGGPLGRGPLGGGRRNLISLLGVAIASESS